MAGSYYRKTKGMNQMKTVTNNLMAGINMLKKSDAIGDDQLSDAWGAQPDETTGGILLTGYGNSTYTGLDGTGEIVAGISAMDMDSQEYVFLLTKDVSDVFGNDYLDNLVKIDVSGSSPVEIDISSYNLSYDYVSMCLFSTEAKRFVCFIASDVKKLFYYDFSTLKTWDLPFYPKKIVSHYNRIFAIDTSNKLWWSRAGDLASWYGLDKDDDYIVENTTMVNSTYTILANPDVPRPLMVTVTKASTLDTLGILTVVGTDVLDDALTEVITPVDGIAYGLKAFKTVTSITGSGWTAKSGADSIKIGVAPVTGFSQTDAGFWTLEQEYSLVDMAVLSSALYIWSPFNIYVFQGYSYDTFSLTKVIANLGCVVGTNIATCGNIAYFWGTQTELYEYNGNDYPNVINKPVYVNGSVANGIYGSIPDTIDMPVLVAIAGKVYLYSKAFREDVVGVDPDELYYFYFTYYEFDVRSRSWWKQPGLLSLYDYDVEYGVDAGLFYIPNVALSDTYNLLWFKDSADDAEWAMYYYRYDTYYTSPYIVTKAYNNGITEDQTLTNLILYVRYGEVEVGGVYINVYYSKTTDDSDDWTLLYAYSDTDMETMGEPTIITINLVGSELARTRHFRLKITASTDVQLCGIERRYRVIGRSR
jgi:hypothetical protein